MKKFVAIMLCLILFVGVFSIQAFAETPYEQMCESWQNLQDVAHDIMVQDAINTLAGTYAQYGLTPCEVREVMNNASDWNSGLVTLNTMVRDKYYTAVSYQLDAYANQLYWNYYINTYCNNFYTVYVDAWGNYHYVPVCGW